MSLGEGERRVSRVLHVAWNSKRFPARAEAPRSNFSEPAVTTAGSVAVGPVGAVGAVGPVSVSKLPVSEARQSGGVRGCLEYPGIGMNMMNW